MIEATLNDRQTTHGDFTDVAECSQGTLDFWKERQNWDQLTNVQKEALTLIAHKVARILSGNPNHADHWHDIQGYAKLAEDDAREK